MRATRTIALFAAALLTCGWAADDVSAKFNKAFAEGEASDKKEALRMAAGLSKEQDDLAFELLIKAVNDRQVHDEAVLALRARTGMQPTLNNRGTGYPGYPASDDASGWNSWLSARKKEQETAKKLAEQEKKLKQIDEDKKKKEEEEAKKKDGKGGDTAAKPDGEAKPEGKDGDTAAKPEGKDGEGTKTKPKAAYEPPTDLGKVDRIVFKTGGSLVCYILSKRSNSDGVLQSVRVSHLDDGGEEILSMDLIARIEEDIR
jgi:hypothetical protein